MLHPHRNCSTPEIGQHTSVPRKASFRNGIRMILTVIVLIIIAAIERFCSPMLLSQESRGRERKHLMKQYLFSHTMLSLLMIAFRESIERDLAEAQTENERLTGTYSEKLADLLEEIAMSDRDYLVSELPVSIPLEPEADAPVQDQEREAQASEDYRISSSACRGSALWNKP